MTSGFDRALDSALEDIAKVADAVLFEGYLLYPYRASAQKNQLRWQFGVLTPQAWAPEAGEQWCSRTEVLLEPRRDDAVLRVRLRFLRLRQRRVQRREPTGEFVDTERLVVRDAAGPDGAAEAAGPDGAAEAAGTAGATGAETLHLAWDEGLPEVVDADLPLPALAGAGAVVPVDLPASVTEEPITAADGTVAGRLRRECWAVRGRVLVATEPVPGPYGALRLSVRVENTGPGDAVPQAAPGQLSEQGTARDGALRQSLIAAHTVLALAGGEFLSMTDPPEWARPAVRACVNEHVWPVLSGDRDRPNVVLSSPIILEDFPEIAPESPNQLFDGLENDEILTLRTMVLTDEEKREARATDPRAAYLVDAVDSMPPEILERLHGAIRSMGPAGPTTSSERGAPNHTGAVTFDGVPTFGQVFDAFDDADPRQYPAPVYDEVPTYSHDTGGKPWWDPGQDAAVDPDTDWVLVDGHRVAKGTRVLLRPGGRADAQDLFLVGRPALVEAVLNDVDGDVHLAVSLTDDPAAEFQAAHGRFRYFRPDEVQVCP